MPYVIDAAGEYATAGRREVDANIVLVGCGGTGGFLAEALCRLLIGHRSRIFLVDPDRVESHNVARQAFDRRDVDRFKAEVLAERLSRRFEREVGYSVLPYDRELHAKVLGGTSAELHLIVGCVDNAAARRAIAGTLEAPSRSGWRSDNIWWLDCGNGRNSGQILLGNTTRPEELRRAFVPARRKCRALPAPSLQRSDLLIATPEPRRQPDCAEAVGDGEQGPTINQMVASIAASFVEKLLAGTCGWMASYFDLDDGTLRCLPADPKVVADIAGLHVNAVASPTACH
ncbi:MAG: ThiF family adenylyltransferase [Chloroflexi bacterium]|nr:ThiF family adenylyltransferase [Chloroflexota bacterium]